MFQKIANSSQGKVFHLLLLHLQIPPKLRSLKHGYLVYSHDSEAQLGFARQFWLEVSRSFSQIVPGTGILLKVDCGCPPQLRSFLTAG